MNIILASSSKYRSQLLSKTGLSFTSLKPILDEDFLKNKLLQNNKSPLEIAEILSRSKGQSILNLHPKALVISGDQLVDFNQEIIGKPHTQENAIIQLKKMNGQNHQLITATTLFFDSKIYHNNHITKLKMKKLTDYEIESYVALDNPVDCAGSIKIESHGLCLFENIECTDFSAIEGLPLIWITNTLKGLGYELFKK